jgi:hypothetical protein
MRARTLAALVLVGLISSVFSGLTYGASLQTVTLQPGPGLNNGTDDGSAAKGKDAVVQTAYWLPDGGYGDWDYLYLYNSP